MKRNHSFFYRNGLSLVLAFCFFVCLIGQIYTGIREHNQELVEHHAEPIDLAAYLTSGHFFQTTFENWESEFLQMGMYVLATVSFRQKGSSESKSLDEAEEVDRKPDANKKDAPWPVRKGGFMLALYRNSLSLAFIILFMLSFIFHASGSLKNYNEEQLLKGEQPVPLVEFMGSTRFWFESFQNWQSEFVAVFSIVVLSIFLRQYGSPESKPVDASLSETGT